MRPDIEKFFARYGAALSSDDVSGIVSCFDPPTVVVDDAATTLMIDHAHVEEYFTGMAERYRARGALSAADSRPAPELVAEWAQTLDAALYSGTAQQRKALIRKLVNELRVLGRDEIIPTYRVPALVRAPGNQVDQSGVEPPTSPVRGVRSTS